MTDTVRRPVAELVNRWLAEDCRAGFVAERAEMLRRLERPSGVPLHELTLRVRVAELNRAIAECDRVLADD